jgi:hypothetical protein
MRDFGVWLLFTLAILLIAKMILSSTNVIEADLHHCMVTATDKSICK